jgi:hypothetical protein
MLLIYILSRVLRLATESMWLMQQVTGRYLSSKKELNASFYRETDTNAPEINNIYTHAI